MKIAFVFILIISIFVFIDTHSIIAQNTNKGYSQFEYYSNKKYNDLNNDNRDKSNKNNNRKFIFFIQNGQGYLDTNSYLGLGSRFLYLMLASDNTQSTDMNRKNLGIIQLAMMGSYNPKKSDKSVQNTEFGFEYQIRKKTGRSIGFGISVSQTSFVFKHRNLSQFDFLFTNQSLFYYYFFINRNNSTCYTGIENSCNNFPPTVIDYMTLVDYTIKIKSIASTDVNFYYHFMKSNKTWDPFIRYNMGFGNIYNKPFVKGGPNLGIRYYLNSDILVYFEYSKFIYLLDKIHRNGIEEDYYFYTNSINFGFGGKFW